MKGLGFNAREFTPRILMLCEVSLSSWRDLSKECHDCIGVMSRTYLANMGTCQEDVAVVQVRHDKSLGQVSGAPVFCECNSIELKVKLLHDILLYVSQVKLYKYNHGSIKATEIDYSVGWKEAILLASKERQYLNMEGLEKDDRLSEEENHSQAGRKFKEIISLKDFNIITQVMSIFSSKFLL